MKTPAFILSLFAVGLLSAQDYYEFKYDNSGNVISITPIMESFVTPIDSILINTDLKDLLKVTVTPNPTTGIIEVFANGASELTPIEIKIFSPSGKMIYNVIATGKRLIIDISDEPSGIYIIQASYKGQMNTVKFIKTNVVS